MSILKFDDYIKEFSLDTYFKKILFVTKDRRYSCIFGDISPEATEKCAKLFNRMFNWICWDEALLKRNVVVPDNQPVIWYGGAGIAYPKADEFVEKYLNTKNMYNMPSCEKFSGNKVTFSKEFGDYDWHPKTCYDWREAAEGKVGFPFVAKISNGHAGLGVKKFEEGEMTEEKNRFLLKKPKKTIEREYELYCQCIDFDHEYRCILLRDEMFILNERVPDKRFDKGTIKTKGENDKMHFNYVVQDLEKVDQSFKDEIKKIATDILKKHDMRIWAIDVVLDKEGKAWVLEVNTEMGLGASKLCKYYQVVYEDYYKQQLPDWWKKKMFEDIEKQTYEFTYKNAKEAIEYSKWPIDYKKILEG